MAELNIPNLNKKSDKYLFKKKLTLRRKSKKQLLIESFYMVFISFLLLCLNYLISNKLSLFKNFSSNFENILKLSGELFYYIYQILLVIFIICSLLITFLLIVGSLSRVLKVMRRKTKQVSFK
tara:strand:- start:573 stop:941 length:369 start_codon:yes stop_codon:yes gene_type:complete